MHLGWLNFISANCLGAAIGAIIGGFLADKYGRKFIYTYNLLVYMLGVALIICSVNFPMLLCGFLITGISVGIGVPASWTYISESSEVNNRGRTEGRDVTLEGPPPGPSVSGICVMRLSNH